VLFYPLGEDMLHEFMVLLHDLLCIHADCHYRKQT
jgi:hypothetical protein